MVRAGSSSSDPFNFFRRWDQKFAENSHQGGHDVSHLMNPGIGNGGWGVGQSPAEKQVAALTDLTKAKTEGVRSDIEGQNRLRKFMVDSGFFGAGGLGFSPNAINSFRQGMLNQAQPLFGSTAPSNPYSRAFPSFGLRGEWDPNYDGR